ncbi:MAG TPA: CHAT domain-containing tetratricopeptide repeat protein [Nostocaceae cyanobacterium]|nr:CHAT domain-containing tetratricopeptide repeat protein [Nostocaceae cyanobacterium]
MSIPKQKTLKIRLLTVSLLLTFTSYLPASLAQTNNINQSLLLQQNRAKLLLDTGNKELNDGQFRPALASLGESLRIFNSIGDRLGAANALLKIGETYFSLGQYYRAISAYQNSLDYMVGLGELKSQVELLERLSNAYLNIGDDQQAKELTSRANALRKDIGNPPREGGFLANLGLNHETIGEQEKAIEFYSQQLTIALENRDQLLQADALRNLATVNRQIGQNAQAVLFYQQELALARKLGDKDGEAVILQKLGETYTTISDFPQAIAFYQQQLEQAKKSPETIDETPLIRQLGRAYIAAKQEDKAFTLYQEQLTNAKLTRNDFKEAIALNNLGYAYFKTSKLSEAQTTLLSSIPVWERLRAKADFPEDYRPEQANTYNILQQIFITQNQPESALEISEQGSTMGFLTMLGQRLESESAGSGLQITPSPFSPLKIAQIKTLAQQEQATLVKYNLSPEGGIYVWVISPKGEMTFRQIDPKTINTISPYTSIPEIIASLPYSLGVKKTDKKLPKDNQPLLQLNQIFIKPIADLLPGNPNERVIFIPQDELLLVPFPALIDVTGKYLIEKHTISIAPSIQTLNLTRDRRTRTGGGRVLVVGNTVMPKVTPKIGLPVQQLAPLLKSEQEALEVADFFKTKAFISNQATKAAILQELPKARIIHFATYALLDDLNRKGIPGAIVLSALGSDDGILSASEIINLFGQPKGKGRLRANLAVITAGEPGISKNTGAGIQGLSLALINAGVPSIIYSQWSVSDAPTNEFMGEFYRQFQRNSNKAQALRNTILTIKKKYPEPKYWAGFNLIGEAR